MSSFPCTTLKCTEIMYPIFKSGIHGSPDSYGGWETGHLTPVSIFTQQ